MKTFKIGLLTLLGFLCYLTSLAQKTEVNGLYFEPIPNVAGEAQVVGTKSSSTITEAVIPATVMIDGQEYKVTTIAPAAFWHCFALNSINLGNVRTLQRQFLDCPLLTSIYIPSSVTQIEERLTIDVNNLESIVVDKSNTVYSSPNDCNAIVENSTGKLLLGSINTIIPENVLALGDGAFENCNGLNFLDLKNVKSIGFAAFQNCTGLIAIDSKNVNTIENYAFYGCTSLKSIDLKNIQTIGTQVFGGCNGLQSIKIRNTVPGTLEIDAFEQSVYDTAELQVPSQAVEAYRQAPGWSEFKHIVPLDILHYEVIPDKPGEAKVVAAPTPYEYKGDIIIPATVMIDGQEYKVTTIGKSAFKDCTGLVSIDFGSVQTIEGDGSWEVSYGAFEGCTGLTSLDLKHVQTIEDWAFSNCTGLALIDFSEVQTIGTWAFVGCTDLSSMTVASFNSKYSSPKGSNALIETASKTLVLGCKTTVIPEYVQTLKNGAFAGCTGLTSIFIPSSVTTIDYGPFQLCSGLTSIVVDKSNPIYSSPNGCNAIIETASKTLVLGCKTTVIPDNVQTIGHAAYVGCSGLTSIDLKNVRTINRYAFWFCSGLTSMDLKNVELICDNAFKSCSHLTSIDLKNVRTIDMYAFEGCDGLQSIKNNNTVPSTLDASAFEQSVYDTAELQVPSQAVEAYRQASGWNEFKHITPLDILHYEVILDKPGEVKVVAAPNPQEYKGDIVIPAKVMINDQEYKVTTIGLGAFRDCTGLTSIDFGEVQTIESHAFNGCSGLTSVHFGKVQRIGGYAFRDCRSLTSIDLKNVNTIEELAFMDCIGIKSIDLGEIQILDRYVFSGCIGLTSVDLKRVRAIGDGVFYHCTGLTSVDLKSVKTIGGYAFSRCIDLTSIDLKNVDIVEEKSFEQCTGLTSIDLGYVQSIGTEAFGGCNDLTSIQTRNIVPGSLEPTAFEQSVYDTAELQVPLQAVEAYHQAPGWSQFKHVVPFAELHYEVIPDKPGEVKVVAAPNPQEYKGDIVIPAMVKIDGQEYKVTTIGEGAFNGCSGLTSIDFGDVLFIESDGWQTATFASCIGLTSLNFKKVQHIDRHAFCGCSGLTSINISSSLTSIDGNPFVNCINLVSISVDAANPLYESPENSNAIVEKKAQTIVSGCKTTIIPETVKKIRFSAFESCKNLMSIDLKNVIYIDNNAFFDCTGLKFVDMQKVDTIGQLSFYGCTGLTSLDLKQVQVIALNAFRACTGLTSVDFKNVKVIGSSAFQDCTGLISLDLKNVNTIRLGAFSGCTGLISIKTSNVVPGSLDDSAFEQSVYDIAELQVPYESLSDYRSTEPWNKFRHISASTLQLYDKTDIYAQAEDVQVSQVEYFRNFRNNTDWQALYVPFGMDYADWSQNFQIARINNMHQYDEDNDGVVDRSVLEVFILPENSSIEPNTPYVIRAKEAGDKVLTVHDVLLKRAESASIDCASVDYRYTFTGTYQGLDGGIKTKGYYVMAPGGLKQVANDQVKLGGFRWYMAVESRNGNSNPLPQTLSLRIVDEFGNVTGIGEVDFGEESHREWPADVYNLNGQLIRVNAMSLDEVPSGVYIVNGKKIIK